MAKYSTAEMSARTDWSYEAGKLVHLDGPQAGQWYALDELESVVGCGMDCNIFIHDTTVSRRHFAILRAPDCYLIRDLDSTNGTFVNGVRIKEAYLQLGQVIRAGQLSFRLDPA
ncbi:MAG: hypothetical protein DRI90_25965 [Deltaproteobacteria bacterium]|nr:MAG: hypothetical protein DRI90_25965 [Deltaproteobacteria bacterium]